VDDLRRCSEFISLTDDELRRVESLPDPMNEVDADPGCFLQVGHPGPHFALCQDFGQGQSMWARWLPPDDRDLVVMDPCPGEPEAGHPRAGWVCGLPAGHQLGFR
jgi:hypothetical protein